MLNFRIKVVLFLFCFLSLSCSKTYHLADTKDRTYRIEKASYPVDVKVAGMIEPFKMELDKTMNEVIGYNEEELTKGRPSSTLTNWFCDVLLDEAQKLATDKIDFAIQNFGGIRVPFLSKGNVTIGTVYELMPFDNILYILDLKGSQVQALFDKMAEAGGGPVSRGVYFEIAYSKAKNVNINNVPIAPDQIYKVAIPDYVANGGDDMSMLVGVPTQNTATLIRDMIINNLKSSKAAGNTIKPNMEKRIIMQ
jgi:2',3'-cyclic-nucleotide 2'-phosphodiesterase (5'-nucleotidase family)